MNCKLGDLAIVISCKQDASHIGKIVRCIEFTNDINTGEPGWIVEPKLGKWRGVKDASLKPIGNPSDDASDETLEWLPVPSKEKETA